MKLEQMIESATSALDYELVTVDYVPQRGNTLLRVYIDKPDGITIEDCEKVSRQISALLDVEDPISGNFTLEVSSPGIERPLVKPEHFKMFCGERVKVATNTLHLCRKRFTGKLVEVNDSGIVVDMDGEEYELPFADINNARLSPEWE